MSRNNIIDLKRELLMNKFANDQLKMLYPIVYKAIISIRIEKGIQRSIPEIQNDIDNLIANRSHNRNIK